MYDVMLDEAKMWLDEPPRRKRKLEAPPPAPIVSYNPEPYTDSDEDEIDPVEREKYRIQLVESGGTNLQFITVKKANADFHSIVAYYITLEAMDPFTDSLVTFQTSVWDASTRNKEKLRLLIEVCRIKGTGEETGLWDADAVDEFYKDDMSQWLEGDALTGSDKLQYYELKESDLRDNEWLYLYAEIAMFSERASDLSAYLPVEMNKVVVRTREDVEPSKKLKSKDATFYMSFKARGGPECRGIIRRTSDGRPRHMSLQAKCWIDK
ncbi:unnamed protein product [Thlaspi arvense]|uniref:Uncharacterized protein n=1 Tax=Thlaspi arvense TaxID=13288 RepID=A0AAU9S9Y5_THLAR|nr:unnamed protein product [Thlaspi arvense]